MEQTEGKQYSWKKHAIGSLVLVVLGSLLISLWGKDDHRRAVADLDDEIADLQANLSYISGLQRRRGKAPDVSKMRRELKDIQDELVKFSEGVDVDRPVMVDLANQAALHSLLIEVLDRAKSNRLQVLSSEAGDSRKRGAFYDQRKSYRLRLRGSYLDYYNLLEDFKQLPYTVLIAEIDLKKMVGGSFLEIQMTILV